VTVTVELVTVGGHVAVPPAEKKTVAEHHVAIVAIVGITTQDPTTEPCLDVDSRHYAKKPLLLVFAISSIALRSMRAKWAKRMLPSMMTTMAIASLVTTVTVNRTNATPNVETMAGRIVVVAEAGEMMEISAVVAVFTKAGF
jgi:hypothetical protein